MKRFPLLILSLFFLLKTPSTAQDFNWNFFQENYNKTTTAFSLGNDRWLVGIRVDADNNNGLNVGVVHMVDSTGSIWSDANIDRISGRTIIERFLRNGDKIFVLIRAYSNSYIISYLLKEDSMEFVDMIEFEERILIDKIELLPNGKIIGIGSDLRTSVSTSYAYWTVISHDFTQEHEDFSYLGRINDLILLEDSTFLLSGGIGDTIDYGMKKMDLNYNELESYLPGIFLFRSLQMDNKDIFITWNGLIQKLNSSFEIDTTIFLSNIEVMKDIKVDGNKLYVFGAKNNVNKILELDDNLSLVDSHFIDIPNFIPEKIDVQNGIFIIAGKHTLNIPDQGVPHSYPKITASFYTYLKNKTPNFSNNNLKVESVRVNKFARVKDCTPHFNKYNLLLKIVEVDVVNKGDIPIEKFNLFIRAPGLQNCSDYTPEGRPYDQTKRISNIMLMPGDSMRVIFQDMKFPQYIQDSVTINLCVWVNAVNQKIDGDMNDNIICDEYELIQTEYVEAPIVAPEENELLIYPNPSSNRIAVSLKTAPFKPSVIEFFDMIGRRMQSNIIAPRATYKEIDISNLPDGIYFVRVKNDLVEETIRFFKK